jgi:hypothetical protein
LVICDGNTIDVYVGLTMVSTRAIHYASASFNATATGVKVSGFVTGTDLVAWPRTLSGAALAELVKYTS